MSEFTSPPFNNDSDWLDDSCDLCFDDLEARLFDFGSSIDTPAIDAEQQVIEASDLLPTPRASLRDDFIAEVAKIEQRRERLRKTQSSRFFAGFRLHSLATQRFPQPRSPLSRTRLPPASHNRWPAAVVLRARRPTLGPSKPSTAARKEDRDDPQKLRRGRVSVVGKPANRTRFPSWPPCLENLEAVFRCETHNEVGNPDEADFSRSEPAGYRVAVLP